MSAGAVVVKSRQRPLRPQTQNFLPETAKHPCFKRGLAVAPTATSDLTQNKEIREKILGAD